MDLTRVRPVFDQVGPFLTVHCEVGRTTEDAQQQLEARWTTLRHDLEHQKLDNGLVEEIGSRLAENAHVAGEARRTLVATTGDQPQVVFDEVQAGHSWWPETTDLSPLPDLSGWLTTTDRAVSLVLVVADREGADIDVYRALSAGVAQHREVQGETFQITKVAEGDWAQKQFQQSAENAWHHNAQEVADTVRSLAREHRPRLVVVAGDVRARNDIAGQLENLDATVVTTEAGGRAAGASDEALWREVEVAVADITATDDQAVAEQLSQARGQGQGAANGLDEVLDALAKSQVDRLVLDLQAAAEKTVDPAKHPELAVPSGAADAGELPADRVLVAAAALTDASVTLLPSELGRGGGVSALLRWSEPPG